MQSLPSDLYAYTFKNPKRNGSFSNMLADMYNITHMSPLWHISASAQQHLSLAGMMLTAGFYPKDIMREYY